MLSVVVVFLVVSSVLPERIFGSIGVKVIQTTCLMVHATKRMYDSQGSCYIVGDSYEEFEGWLNDNEEGK